MYSKVKIYNLALSALLLSKQVIDVDEKSNEAKILGLHYDVALASTLQSLDLDSTSSQATLELIEEDPNDLWGYSYKYPSKCIFLRRIQSGIVMDNRTSHIPKRVAIKDGKKVIFTNLNDAIVEYIPNDVPLGTLSASAGLCVAFRLAVLAAPLVVGKGATKLREEIEKKYIVSKAEAQAQDRAENFNFVEDDIQSEFVEARIE